MINLQMLKRKSFCVERVDIYEDELPDGRFLRHIKFKFPVFYNGQEIDEMSWDKESTVETVALLTRGQNAGDDYQAEE